MHVMMWKIARMICLSLDRSLASNLDQYGISLENVNYTCGEISVMQCKLQGDFVERFSTLSDI